MKREPGSLPKSVMDQVRKLEAKYPQDLIAVFDADGKYRYASIRQEKLLGYRPDELMGGMGWRDVVAQRDKPHMLVTWDDAALTGDSIDVSFEVVTKFGQHIPVRGNSHQIYGSQYWLSRVWVSP